jgi:hypothetical protein
MKAMINPLETRIDCEAVDLLVRIAAGFPEAEGREGGFFGLCDLLKKQQLDHIKPRSCTILLPFGKYPEEKRLIYLGNAGEKIFRLVKNGEIRSHSSRNEANRLYGGGIHEKDSIYSFSGFPQLLDEAIALSYSFYRENYSAGQINDIVSQYYSDNNLILDLYEKFCKT